jgi:succinate-semialdehyde dehydrogenase / glutarate-semialdehyde dehydrogenase
MRLRPSTRRLACRRRRQGADNVDTEHGLCAYFYTRDIGRGMRISSKVEAGMIALNRGLVSDPAAPFGGVKQSGLGREGGQHHGIAEFMEAKYIATSF